MKNTTKTILIVVGVIVLAVALLLTAVFVLSERLAALWKDSGFRLPDPTTIGISGGSDYRSWENDFAADGSYWVDAANLTGLDLHWIAGRVDVTVGDGDRVSFSESAKAAIAPETALRFGVAGGVLYIQYCPEGAHKDLPVKNLALVIPRSLAENMEGFSFDGASCDVSMTGLSAKEFSFDSASGRLTATEMQAERVRLDTASGDVAFSGSYETLDANTASGSVDIVSRAAARETDIDTSSGRVRLAGEMGILSVSASSGRIESTDDVIAATLAINTSSGDASLAGRFEEIETDTASGRMEIASAVCPKRVRMDSMSGDAVLTLPEGSAFTLRFDTLSGTFESDFPVAMQGKTYIAGDGAADFSVDTASGKLNIRMQ